MNKIVLNMQVDLDLHNILKVRKGQEDNISLLETCTLKKKVVLIHFAYN